MVAAKAENSPALGHILSRRILQMLATAATAHRAGVRAGRNIDDARNVQSLIGPRAGDMVSGTAAIKSCC